MTSVAPGSKRRRTAPAVLVVGQTPPPVHGQALMIERLIAGKYRNARIVHVRMAFARDSADIGRARPGKLVALVATIVRIWWVRLRHRPPIVYYHPAGANRVAMLRDLALLGSTRWAFRRTVLHFHAAGLASMRDGLSRPSRWWFDRCYGGADLAIRPSADATDDGAALHAHRSIVVENGVPDIGRDIAGRRVYGSTGCDPLGAPSELLYLGLITPEKGLPTLIEAFSLLRERGVDARLALAGASTDSLYEQELQAHAQALGVEPHIRWLGVVDGDAKDAILLHADLLVQPTVHPTETSGLALLEAASCALPAVATRWGGNASIVEDGVTGVLVEPEDAEALARAIAGLLDDPEQRGAMGRAARARYLECFTVDRFQADVDAALGQLLGADEGA